MEKKINTKALVGIVLFCLGGMATNMTMGILANIMQSYTDVAATTVQSVLVGPALIGTIFAFFVGQLNRKISAKKIEIIAQAALLVYGCIFMFLGGTAPIWVLIAASGLAGFNQGSMYTVLGILMTSAVPDENKRGAFVGIGTSLMSLGGVFFTTVGGILATTRWQNAYLLFFYYIIAIVLELILLPNVEPEGKVIPQAGGQAQKTSKGGMGRVWLLSAHYFFFFLFLYVFGTNVSEYVITTYQLGTSVEAGIAASCVTIGGIVAGALFGLYSKVLKRFTVPVLMFLSVIGLGVPLFITTSIIGIYLSGLLLGFAMMGASPYITEFMHEIAPPDQFGQAMSIYSMFMNAGMVVAIYVIAFLTQLVCGDANSIHHKFLVAFVGSIFVFATSFFVYIPKTKTQD